MSFCMIGSDSFIVYIKSDNIYEDIKEDIEKRFDTLNYELELHRSLPKEKKRLLV